MRTLIEFLALVLIVMSVGIVSAQKTTEIYIPIRQSPGLSKDGKTVIGEVVQVFAPKSFKMGDRIIITYDRTQFYIDRSHLRKTNHYGKFEDIKEGSFVEVYVPLGMVFAEWVKIKGME